MRERGTYGVTGSGVLKGLSIGLVIAGVLVAPVIAIIGGTALASAVSGRDKR